MSWIETVPYDASEGRLRRLYDRIRTPEGDVDNIMKLHSLRPHTLEGHMALYKSVLHHTGNSLPGSLLETIGTYVSLLNGCGYCVEHHFEGLKRLLRNDERATALRRALEEDRPDAVFDERECAVLAYTKKLTMHPSTIVESDLVALRSRGFTDAEILEINQVAAYFAYANRTVLGLGCSTEGDVLGLSPGDGEHPDEWRHS